MMVVILFSRNLLVIYIYY